MNKNSTHVGSILLSLLFGLVGAILWAIIVNLTGYNLGIAAIAVGYLVSQAFVLTGKGNSAISGVIAAVIAALSIFIGKVLVEIILVSQYYGVSFFEMVPLINFGQLMGFIVKTFELFDLVFYAIALQTAYKRSFNKTAINLGTHLKLDDHLKPDDHLKLDDIEPQYQATPETEAQKESRLWGK